LFRIDRRLVKVSDVKFSKFDNLVSDSEEEDSEEDLGENLEGDFEGDLERVISEDGEDEDFPGEVDAEDEVRDAAASAEAIAENAVNEYITAAKSETEAKIEAILENAHEEAERIIARAEEEAEEERERARQKGFEEGAEEGKRSYDDRIAEKISEDDETLKRVLDEIYNERERAYAEMEGEVVNLAIEIVRKIINPAEEELGDVFLSLIKNALRQMDTDSKIVIRVGVDEYERYFSSGAATIELDSGIIVKASVLRDVSLEEGDCIIDSDDVTINAGVESQLQYVQLAFERANQYEPD